MENQFDFAEREARIKKLNEQLATAPVVTLIGVVGALSPGGARSHGDVLWTMRVSLEAWRIDSGEMQTRRMSAKRLVTDEELDIWQKAIKPYSILRGRARVVDDAHAARPEAVLEEITISGDTDQQLDQFARKLQEPVTYQDPVFGTLTLDRRGDSFRGRSIWNSSYVGIELTADHSGSLIGSLSTLHHLWKDQQRWGRRIGDFAVQELLPLKNDNWLEENELPLTADEFKARMNLDSISVDGLFYTFWHSDGDMFWGHSIEICGTLEAGPTSADIPG